jgi:hypothetical protein
MQKACELLINSMTQTEFIDLAEEAMLNFHEADDLFRSILTIKQADDDLNRPKEPRTDERVDYLFDVLQGMIPALANLFPEIMQEAAKP